MLATINGVQLAYSDIRPQQPARHTLLLVHGFTLSRAMWDPQVEALRDHARIIAPDLRGFGASDAGPPGPLTMAQHADDLAALLEHLGIDGPVVYCGLSMGGYVAFRFWERHRARVAGLVLADTRAGADSPARQAQRLESAARAEDLNDPTPVFETLVPHLFAPDRPFDTPVAQRVLGIVHGTSLRGAADGQRGLAQRPDSVPLLPEIDVPTLIMVGEHDQLTPPAESELMAERIPRAVLVQVHGAGHMSNLEAPELFNAALGAFLEALEVHGQKR